MHWTWWSVVSILWLRRADCKKERENNLAQPKVKLHFHGWFLFWWCPLFGCEPDFFKVTSLSILKISSCFFLLEYCSTIRLKLLSLQDPINVSEKSNCTSLLKETRVERLSRKMTKIIFIQAQIMMNRNENLNKSPISR